ncbi:MAG: endopeptidase La [Bacteroidales bacterium]|nr:endopeptidase La [Bacteroidales bacterium]
MDKFFLSDFIDDDSGGIPIVALNDDETLDGMDIDETLPILPLRNSVLYPGVVFPITVGRNKSLKLVGDYGHSDNNIGVLTQKNNDVEDPAEDDMYRVGTMARILKQFTMPNGSITILVQGIRRFELVEVIDNTPYLTAKVKPYPTNDYLPKFAKDKTFNALVSSVRESFSKRIQLTNNLSPETAFALKNIESPILVLNFAASNLTVEIETRQKILEIQNVVERAKLILKLINQDVQLAELKNQIQRKSQQQLEKEQREYFLNQQIKTIQKELGSSPTEKAVQELKEKAEKKHWNKETSEIFNSELEKFERINPMSPDFSVELNYLEFFVNLPWNEYSEDNFDLKHAREVLDKDHFGLEQVKERIIEYLAVLKLKGDMKSPILCLAGPPGVGKTSLGKSVANALGRKYVRVSLGGLHDEAEIRGHRKTYIGAQPGRILQSMKKAGFSNPVFVLDEIDKVSGMNVQGDPSAALLEVLDPEQNNSFYDNYLEASYDLSKVLFIATANNLANIPSALLDRMEIIDITGYFIEEKIEIAKRHLVPKQLEEHGLSDKKVQFSDEILQKIVSDYTRESGVRLLEKRIAKIIRSRAAHIAQGDKIKRVISDKDLTDILGAPMFQQEKSLEHGVPGVATGLAWTPVGGEILFVEAIISPSKNGGLSMTGNLGDVMKESATIAYEYLKAHAGDYGIEPSTFEEKKVHIHVPEGAIPKDGPSAGITLLSSMISAFTGRNIRPKVAMTGEITLRGKLLPVGGIKEKILAAKRSGIFDIALSSENKKDVDDIKGNFIDGMRFHYFSSMKDAVNYIVEK